MIASWWASLSLIMKILWGVTLAASLVFIIQSVLTFIGADMGGDFDLMDERSHHGYPGCTAEQTILNLDQSEGLTVQRPL